MGDNMRGVTQQNVITLDLWLKFLEKLQEKGIATRIK
jgi:hypothetical protein